MPQLTAVDLKAPNGEIEDFMFPNEDVGNRLQKYLEEAYVKVATLAASLQDDAAKAWAYHRAYKAILARMSATPAKATLDSGKSEYEFTAEQIKEFKSQRDYWLTQYQGFFSTTPVGVAIGQMKDPTPKNTVFI